MTTYGWRVTSDHARILIFAEAERASFYRAVSVRANGTGDGQTVLGPAGTSIAEAAARNGIELRQQAR
jgi:hypothetical protein